MGNIGCIEKISDSTYSWFLNTKGVLGSRTSENFTISKTEYTVWFRLNVSTIQNDSFLYLCTFQSISGKLDLQIVLRYKNETKDFFKEDCVFQNKNNDTKEYFLATLDVTDLLEIKCTFHINEKSVSRACVTEKKEVNAKEGERCRSMKHEDAINKDKMNEPPKSIRYTSANDDKKAEPLRKFEIDDKIPSTDINDPLKLKGLTGLSENLLAFFLSEEDSDVIFNVGGQMYPAHKVIIKARSPVFQAMFKHDMEERKEGVINIRDCDPHIFKDFLLYIYTGKLDNISKENVLHLFCVSDKYDVKDLKVECIDFISKNLTVDAVCDVIFLAKKYSERNLLTRATEFFIANAKDVLPTVNWQKFVQECPTEANELFLKVFNKFSEK